MDIDRYNQIKPLPPEGGFFQHFPGVYCKKCERIFALYSYSAFQPDGVDENGKPYYDSCSVCGKDKKLIQSN